MSDRKSIDKPKIMTLGEREFIKSMNEIDEMAHFLKKYEETPVKISSKLFFSKFIILFNEEVFNLAKENKFNPNFIQLLKNISIEFESITRNGFATFYIVLDNGEEIGPFPPYRRRFEMISPDDNQVLEFFDLAVNSKHPLHVNKANDDFIRIHISPQINEDNIKKLHTEQIKYTEQANKIMKQLYDIDFDVYPNPGLNKEGYKIKNDADNDNLKSSENVKLDWE